MSKSRKPQLPKRPAPDAVHKNPSRADRVQELVAEGARLLAVKRPGDAVALLTEAWELDPDNVAVAINLGGAYILQSKHDRAMPFLETAVRLEPDNPMAWINLAAAYLGKLPIASVDHQDRAIEAFEHALVLDPRAPNVHYNLGLIYLERKDDQRAAYHFQSALETDPNDRDARYYLEDIRQRGIAHSTGPDS